MAKKVPENIFITPVGTKYYCGLSPFAEGNFVILRKDHDNEHDDEAIAIYDPLGKQLGYVANSSFTNLKGCFSAGRMYDLFDEECAASVLTQIEGHPILKVYPDKKLKVQFQVDLVDAEELPSRDQATLCLGDPIDSYQPSKPQNRPPYPNTAGRIEI